MTNPGSVRAQEIAEGYVPDIAVVPDAVLKARHEGAWALTSDGTVLLSDAIPDELADPIGYHEVVHAVKQRGSVEYRAFVDKTGELLNYKNPNLEEEFLKAIVDSRFPGKVFMELKDVELDKVFDEVNAVVWGFYKADPEQARAEFGGVFTDYEGYIAELDAIMEGARGAYAEGGRTPPGGEGAALDAGERRALEEGWRDEEPGGEGAALDAGERRALEEGWRDEEPGVRAAGPYNGAKEAVGYGRGEEALTGLQGVPGADVRGGNPGADATDAGIPRGGGSENGGIQEAPGRGGGAGARLPAWAQGHVAENPPNPAAIRGTGRAGRRIWRSVRAGGLSGISYCLQGRYVPRRI